MATKIVKTENDKPIYIKRGVESIELVFLKTVRTEYSKHEIVKLGTEIIDLVIWDAEDIINDFYESVDDINEIESVEDIFKYLPFEEDLEYAYNVLEDEYDIESINDKLIAAYNDDDAMDAKIETIDSIIRLTTKIILELQD